MARSQAIPDGDGSRTGSRTAAAALLRGGVPRPARRHVGRLIPAAVGCALVLTGCAAGQEAETAQETPDTAGVDGSVGEVDLDDVFLESEAAIPADASVPLRGALTNEAEAPDRLVSVTTPAAQSVQLLQEDGTASAEGIPLPPDGQVDATTGPVRMRLEGVASPIEITETVPITFVFETAGEVTLDVPVGAAG